MLFVEPFNFLEIQDIVHPKSSMAIELEKALIHACRVDLHKETYQTMAQR